jgi:hypothetical protein
MGLFDLFRKDEVTGTKVLVCALDARFNPLMEADGRVYKRFYPATATQLLSGIPELNEAIFRRYDVVHLLCEVSSEGVIAACSGATIAGKQLIQTCCDSNVKLLWIASDNKSDGYIKGFNARGQKINLVMTLDRKGPYFSLFLTNLLARMSTGEAMPVVWNELCPQVANSVHPDAPDSIFFAGRGAVRLR